MSPFATPSGVKPRTTLCIRDPQVDDTELSRGLDGLIEQHEVVVREVRHVL